MNYNNYFVLKTIENLAIECANDDNSRSKETMKKQVFEE